MGDGKIIDKWIRIYDDKKVSAGELHIMYQICTIGWKPFDIMSIIPLKKIHVHIMDGYDIPNTDLIGKTDPYVRIKLNDQEFVQKTKVINNCLVPVWNQTITLYSLYSNPSIQIELKDEATGKDPLIGSKEIIINDIEAGKIKEITEELIPGKGMKMGGKIHLYIQIDSDNPFFNYKFTKHIDVGRKTKKGDGVDSINKIPTTKSLSLYVKIVQAFNLKAMDSNGLSDPYCILQLNNQKKTTSIISECLNPKWDEYFIFDINSLNVDSLKINCMDHDILSKDDIIGSANIQIKSLILGGINNLTIPLKNKNNNKTGELKIVLYVARMGCIPFEEKIWKQKVLNIRILEGNLSNGYLYWIGKFNNEKNNQFITTQKKGCKWMEEYQMLYSHESDVALKLFEHQKKEIEIGQVIIPYKSLQFGVITDKMFNVGKNGKIHLILEINDLGNQPFSSLPPLNIKDNLFYCETFTLNIKIIEAKDIPAMDKSGTSDPYIRLYLLGAKPKDKICEVKTKTIKKTLNPIWNEEYHFPIKSLGTDVLHMSLKDWNGIGKDDPISTFDFYIKNLPFGIVKDDWIHFNPVKGVPKGGLVHIQYHLASPGSYAFVDKPFTAKNFNIKIVEAKEVKSMDLNGLSDPYCKMSIIGDRDFKKTTIKYKTLSPYWNENFNFLITNYETDIFKLELMDKDIFVDDEIGSINLEIKLFEIRKNYQKWIEVKNKGKKQV